MSSDIPLARLGVLRAEHAAVFGYAALGPRLNGPDALRARGDERSHRRERDAVSGAVLAAGAVPVASRGDYALPGLDSALAARRLALQLEVDCARAWRFLLAAASAGTASPQSPTPAVTVPVRADALRGLTAAAVRAMRWRALINPNAPTEPFPGI